MFLLCYIILYVSSNIILVMDTIQYPNKFLIDKPPNNQQTPAARLIDLVCNASLRFAR